MCSCHSEADSRTTDTSRSRWFLLSNHRLHESVVTLAGVTQSDFDAEFTSIEDCFLATFDYGLALVARVLERAGATEEQWLPRIRASLRALLSFFDQEPGWARVLVTAPPGVGARGFARRQHALELLTRLLHRNSPSADAAGRFALARELVAELVTGGVFSVIDARIAAGAEKPLLDLASSLMSMIVLPYLGPEAASAELTMTPAPVGIPKVSEASGGQKTRVTRRTLLVLRAISASPHSSNRDVAVAAGVSDEGQISKLLQRLHRQGLIQNVGLGQAHGEPNAWLLTPSGDELVGISASERQTRAVRTQPAPKRHSRQVCQGRRG